MSDFHPFNDIDIHDPDTRTNTTDAPIAEQCTGNTFAMMAPDFGPSARNSNEVNGPHLHPSPTCTIRGRDSSRPSDLERHAEKHLPGAQVYRCVVQDCEHQGSYRRDKLEQHKKNCHEADGNA